MRIPVNSYSPILKWRQGEYQALKRLDDRAKNGIIPVIIVPPVEFDFEEQCPKKTVQEFIEPFSRRFNDKWGKRPALIGLHQTLETEKMDSGCDVLTHIFSELSEFECQATPLVSLTVSPVHRSAKSVVARDQQGLAIRVSLEEIMSPTFEGNFSSVMASLKARPEEVDLILDLSLPDTFEPYRVFAKALAHAVGRVKCLPYLRSFVLAGSSLNLRGITIPGGLAIRHEWLLYKQLADILDSSHQRIPTYGDYAIESPTFLPSLDMRLITPSARLIYTAGEKWLVKKGTAFRGNEAQMVGLCKSILESGYYAGPEYSDGDLRIMQTATGKNNLGNLSTWKQVGMNHHLTMVVDQVSSFHGS